MVWNHMQLTRREALLGLGASAIAAGARGALADTYRQADASWLANCHFGISTHWTAQSQTVGADDWVPFQEAVNQFSPSHLGDQVAGAWAQYVIFTSAHALQMLPAPCETIDQVAPHRTTKR